MSAKDSPLPFAELLKRATPGEWAPGCFVNPESKCQCTYILAEGYCGSVCVISVDNGKLLSEGGNDAPPIEEARANALLICRLIAWAHAGGVDNLKNALVELETLYGPCENSRAGWCNLRASLALLDGQKDL